MTTDTLTLSDFLLRMFAEDEEVARDASEDSGRWYEDFPFQVADEDGGAVASGLNRVADAAHIARHDPARVLAECEAKRRIVEEHTPYADSATFPSCPRCADWEDPDWDHEPPPSVTYPCPTVRALALPYADHPDYREEWGLG